MVANAKLGRESESSLDGYGGICMCKSIGRQEKKLVLIHVLNYLSDKNLTLTDFFCFPHDLEMNARDEQEQSIS